MDLGIQLAALIVCGSAMTIKDIPNLEGTIPRMEQICDLFAKDTYFSPELLVQETKWRIYYTWNIVMADRCLDMTFQWTTAEVCKKYRALKLMIVPRTGSGSLELGETISSSQPHVPRLSICLLSE